MQNLVIHVIIVDAPSSSEVQAYWEDDSMVATIHTPHEVYVVEVNAILVIILHVLP